MVDLVDKVMRHVATASGILATPHLTPEAKVQWLEGEYRHLKSVVEREKESAP